MEFLQRLPQVGTIQMGINLCCGDTFMSEHFLYRPQVSPLLPGVWQKNAGKYGEIQSFDSGFRTRFFSNMNIIWRESLAPLRFRNKISLISFFYLYVNTHLVAVNGNKF